MPVLVLLLAGLTIGPAPAVHANRTALGERFEIRVGPLRVRGPDVATPVDEVFPAPTTTTTKPSTKPAPAATTTTTTTTKPPAPSPPAEPSKERTQSGSASWYEGRTGQCAHRTLPLKTVVKVTNLENGKSTRCKVTNRGPYHGGRVIDLTKGSFAKVAPLSRGVIKVRVDW